MRSAWCVEIASHDACVRPFWAGEVASGTVVSFEEISYSAEDMRGRTDEGDEGSDWRAELYESHLDENIASAGRNRG